MANGKPVFSKKVLKSMFSTMDRTRAQIRKNQDEKIQARLKGKPESKAEITESNQRLPIEISDPSSQQIVQELRNGECTIFFYKMTNGAARKMRCTLVEQEPVPSKYNKPNIIVVWDLDKNNWRSFYPDRVSKLIRNEETDVE